MAQRTLNYEKVKLKKKINKNALFQKSIPEVGFSISAILHIEVIYWKKNLDRN